MTHYIASAHAYDVMDTVTITAIVRSVPGTGETPAETVLRATTTLSGVGETDPREWLVDILVALLESV